MATREQVSFIDDWDSKDIDIDDLNQVHFAVEGVEYKLDLRTTNLEKFRKDMNKWISVAQKVGAPRGKQRRQKVTNIHDKQKIAEMRTWARENGFEVSDRGRIAVAIQEAYETAHA